MNSGHGVRRRGRHGAGSRGHGVVRFAPQWNSPDFSGIPRGKLGAMRFAFHPTGEFFSKGTVSTFTDVVGFGDGVEFYNGV